MLAEPLQELNAGPEEAAIEVHDDNITDSSLNVSTTDANLSAQNSSNQGKDLVAWVKMDGMESDLVKDFDANLSGLGLELGANAYNMSEVLNLPIFKQESLLGNQGLPPLQYMLCAPTSPATKVYEETLTYLNQGLPYEIKLKKLRDIPDLGTLKHVKSQLRVVFHDRRLQYTEYEQFQNWKFNRPGDRLLNIDIPMSVGVIQPREHPEQLNLVEFIWDVEKEASVFIQVHCISTEFTVRKHGGEKGVPFRIQIDTYALQNNNEYGRYIHSASCQIKVFKPKGADRKQKTDKDKMERRTAQEKLKYQPSYDSTLLSECMPTLPSNEQLATMTHATSQPQNIISEQITEMIVPQTDYIAVSQPRSNNSSLSERHSLNTTSYNQIVEASMIVPDSESINTKTNCRASPAIKSDALLQNATVTETQEWLQRNRFASFMKTFSNFSALDLLTLSRDDTTHICGQADGIRLYNSLRSKPIHPPLTLYLTPASQKNEEDILIYKAYYLSQATENELMKATTSCLFPDDEGLVQQQAYQILYQPHRKNIHVLVTDEVVSVIKDESSFTVHLLKNENSDSFRVIIKP
ncbi:transcription factor CP2 [Ciona intestinalis]